MSETYEYEDTILKVRKGFDPNAVFNDLREMISHEYYKCIGVDCDERTITIEWQDEIDMEMSILAPRAHCFWNTKPFWGRKSEAADDEFFWQIKNGRVLTTGSISVPDPKHWEEWED